MRVTVLVVENDPEVRDRHAAWLDEAGYVAEMCPGPQAPDFECIGSRNGDCPLARSADVVLLDMRLASDEMMAGSPAWHLLCYYVDRHKNVVALSSGDDFVHPLPDEHVTVLRRPPDRDELLSAIERFAG